MIRQCAWCLVMLGFAKPYNDWSVTHGVCKSCEKKFLKEMEEMEKGLKKKP